MRKPVTKLDKAKAALILQQPFFASILCTMPMIEDDTIRPKTMATNGKWIKFHPEFIEASSHDELMAALCHEVGHCIFQHMFRRGGRDPKKWNQAGDYVINDLIDKEKIGKLGAGWLHNPQLVVAGGGTTEGVYALLPDMGDDGDNGHGDPQDSCEDAPGDAAERAEAEARMRVAVAQAAQAAKMCGKMSANLQRFVDAAQRPKVDWKDVLRRFVSARAKVEATYARPKRRFLTEDFVLPSLGGEMMGPVMIAVDCSGSIGEAELNEFAAEMRGIKEDCRPSELHVVYFDSEVCHYDKFEQDEDLHVAPHGGGGTAFSPIFRYAEEHGIEPVCCVVLTDLYCSDFGPPTEYPTLWVTTAATAAPWGEVVEMNPKGV